MMASEDKGTLDVIDKYDSCMRRVEIVLSFCWKDFASEATCLRTSTNGRKRNVHLAISRQR